MIGNFDQSSLMMVILMSVSRLDSNCPSTGWRSRRTLIRRFAQAGLRDSQLADTYIFLSIGVHCMPIDADARRVHFPTLDTRVTSRSDAWFCGAPICRQMICLPLFPLLREVRRGEPTFPYVSGIASSEKGLCPVRRLDLSR
jgi:hypothetical protein